jgi:ATP-dependent DNA ligase
MEIPGQFSTEIDTMKNLAHSASFESLDKNAPLKSGTKQLVAEITYLTWTADGLLRHTVYVGLREDKPAADIRREA